MEIDLEALAQSRVDGVEAVTASALDPVQARHVRRARATKICFGGSQSKHARVEHLERSSAPAEETCARRVPSEKFCSELVIKWH